MNIEETGSIFCSNKTTVQGGENMKKLSFVFAALGVLIMIWSFVGRFIDAREVFGKLIPGGISASSAMIGANTFLLLAILTYLYKKD